MTSYQWQYSSDNSNWINVNGVTSESYDLNTISSTTFYRRGAYRCNINGIKYSNTISKIVNPAPNVNAGLDEMVCTGDSLVLSANGANSYTWNNGVTNLVSFVPSSTTYYVVEGIDGNGCTKKDSLLVEVNSFPIVDAGVDQTTSTGLPLNLSGSTNLNTASGNFEEFILSGSDDVFEYSLSGSVQQTAQNVRIGNRTGSSYGECIAGFKFTSLPIPEGVNITSATLSIYAYDNTSTPISLKIYAEDVDNSSGFSTTNFDISNRSLTTTNVDWDLTGSDSWSQYQIYSTPDISSVFQEIIDRDGWQINNDINIIIRDNGSPIGNNRNISTYDQNSLRKAKINVSYSSGGSVSWTTTASLGTSGWITNATSTQVTDSLQNDHLGDYILTATDNNGCSTSDSMKVVFGPTIISSGTLNPFVTCAGSASAEQTFTVEGVDLTDNITITAPTGYEISTSSGSGFNSSLLLLQGGGVVSTTAIYVRLTSNAPNGASGNVTISSNGASALNLSTGTAVVNSLSFSVDVGNDINYVSGATIAIDATVNGLSNSG